MATKHATKKRQETWEQKKARLLAEARKGNLHAGYEFVYESQQENKRPKRPS